MSSSRSRVLLASAVVATCGTGTHARPQLETRTLTHDGLQREYFVHIPSNHMGKQPVPLVLAFHGGNGRARTFARFTRMAELSERHGFIAVFPQGVNRRWYDQRFASSDPAADKMVDDVGFVRALLDALQRSYPIDPRRVYAMGMSNGGMFCQELAFEVSDAFAAVASVTGQIAVGPTPRTKPRERVSLLLMNGTDDPLVPYEGGDVITTLSPQRRHDASVRTRGRVLSTDETLRFWVRHNRLNDEPAVEDIPNLDADDGTTVVRKTWTDGNVSVVLYRINGGGHTYPGGSQYLPRKMIGNTSFDFDAAEVIWDFFRKHSK